MNFPTHAILLSTKLEGRIMTKHLLRITTLSFLIFLVVPLSAKDLDKLPFYGGIWSTDRGQMALWQVDGNEKVWGLYGKHGKIGGNVAKDDGIFRFTWDEGYNGRGTGWIRLKKNGKAFDGQWIKELDINEHGPWNGDFIGANDFKLGDTAALDWKSGTDQGTKSAGPWPGSWFIASPFCHA